MSLAREIAHAAAPCAKREHVPIRTDASPAPGVANVLGDQPTELLVRAPRAFHDFNEVRCGTGFAEALRMQQLVRVATLLAGLAACDGGDYRDNAIHVVDVEIACAGQRRNVRVDLENGAYESSLGEIYAFEETVAADDRGLVHEPAALIPLQRCERDAPAEGTNELPARLGPHDRVSVSLSYRCPADPSLTPLQRERLRMCARITSATLDRAERCKPVPPSCP